MEIFYFCLEKTIDGDWEFVKEDEDYKKFNPNTLPPSFWKKIGQNTRYIYHPEEILADNFSLMLGFDSVIITPEIIKKMEFIFTEKFTK